MALPEGSPLKRFFVGEDEEIEAENSVLHFDDLDLSGGALPGRARQWRPNGRVSRHVLGALTAIACLGGLATCVLVASGKLAQRSPTNAPQEATMELAGTDLPSLFCFSVMRAASYEEALLKEQLRRRASIFGCNEYAVISSVRMALGNVSWGTVWTWKNPAPTVGMGVYGVNGQKTDSYLNTEIFMQAWHSLITSKKLWKHDFIVKVDPDCVFMPDRLRSHISAHTGQPVFFTNCGKWGARALLYGSVEVYSKEAIQKYQQNEASCKNLPWHGWGEDYYMQHCLESLGVPSVVDVSQVADDRCLSAACTDNSKVAFHPKKDITSYMQCWSQATKMPL